MMNSVNPAYSQPLAQNVSRISQLQQQAPVTFRLANTNDLPQLALLASGVFKTPETHPLEQAYYSSMQGYQEIYYNLSKELDDPKSKIVLCEQNGKLAGMAGVGEDLNTKGGAWLYYVSVAPEAQQRGLGSALVKQAEVLAQQMGYATLNAECDPGLFGFYQKQGFRAIDAYKDDYGVPDLTIQKIIAPVATGKNVSANDVAILGLWPNVQVRPEVQALPTPVYPISQNNALPSSSQFNATA